MTQLSPNHFTKAKKPITLDFVDNNVFADSVYDSTAYKKVLSEWELINIKPELKDYLGRPMDWIKALQRFNDNQVLFPGWKRKQGDNGVIFSKGKTSIYFYDEGPININCSKEYTLTFWNTDKCTVDLTKNLICTENNIKL